MRHRRKTVKLQRDASHRKALLANLVVSLIEHKQIKTTLAKAKAVRPLAEKMVTLGKRGDIHARRLAHGYLHSDIAVAELFSSIAPAAKARQGGYTRITKLGQRHTDSAPMAFIEWVDQGATAPEAPKAEETTKAEKPKKAPAKKAAKAKGEGETKAPAKKRARKTEE
ncbi:MAG: 50S ribosomal protein L17 [Verrucomicrobiales bacterium]|nr:50S ribosomal protein L17 [Verrucomicrobiales bacterium]